MNNRLPDERLAEIRATIDRGSAYDLEQTGLDIAAELLREVDRLRPYDEPPQRWADVAGERTLTPEEIKELEDVFAKAAKGPHILHVAEPMHWTTQWTTGNEHWPDDENRPFDETTVRRWADESDGTTKVWRREVTDWRQDHLDVGG